MYFKEDSLAISEMLNPLRGCFSKPQWGHFRTYVCGLVLGEDGDKNIMDIAGSALDGKDQSSLNRFLHRSGEAVREADRLRLEMAMRGRKGGCLIIDDTLIEKAGRHMEGAGWLYDHCQGRTVWSHNFVNCMWSDGTDTVPLSFGTYLKEEAAEELGRPFRTKIELAMQLVEESRRWIDAECVLFDSWYGANELMEAVRSKGMHFVCEAKSNRLMKFDGRFMQAAEAFPLLNQQEFRKLDGGRDGYDRCCELETELKTGMAVKAVFLTDGKHFRALISDDLKLSAEKMVEKYKVRWNIEVYYRDCKQHLGMGEYQARSIDVGVIHLLLVNLAYTLLKAAAGMSRFASVFKGARSVGTLCQTLKKIALDRLMGGAGTSGKERKAARTSSG